MERTLKYPLNPCIRLKRAWVAGPCGKSDIFLQKEAFEFVPIVLQDILGE
jgi:hypothetical protein